MTHKHTPTLSDWQRIALRHLHAFAAQEGPVLGVTHDRDPDTGSLHATLRLDLTSLKPVAPGGLPVRDTEEIVLVIEAHQWQYPMAYVTHGRFVGHAHVLNGYALCLYLDYAREYHPDKGVTGIINRLWDWLDDAIQARFDPDTALYHAVGGVPHLGKDGPTIVVREPLDTSRRVQNAFLNKRSDHRYDLVSTRRTPDDERVPVIHLDHDLPLGAGHDHLSELLQRIDLPAAFDADLTRVAALLHRLGLPGTLAADVLSQPSWNQTPCPRVPRWRTRNLWNPLPIPPPAPRRPSSVLLTALAATAAKQPPGTDIHAIITVPHPKGRYRHLLGLHLAPQISDALRIATQERNTPTISVRAGLTDPQVPMGWTRISDEREAVTQRRDTGRPITSLQGKTVQIWGLGGIGSWLAEYVARAAPAKLILCDPGLITGGLLVRQNYIETDIGDTKAEALARRLRTINDDLDIVVAPDVITSTTQHANKTDLIIDATISNAVALILNEIAANPHTATLIQVATDTGTGTLGLLSVCAPNDQRGPNQIDEETSKAILANPELERYHAIWADPLPGDELVPTKGCSIPTFHGSAADLAAVAASLTNLIGLHLKSQRSGTHLTALPHTGVKPEMHWEPAP
jgi:hypothetical protein